MNATGEHIKCRLSLVVPRFYIHRALPLCSSQWMCTHRHKGEVKLSRKLEVKGSRGSKKCAYAQNSNTLTMPLDVDLQRLENYIHSHH